MSSSTTYYEYRDVKVKIAHRLFKMDGWKVFGYSPDNSDPMTDYYDPAYWSGIAAKNGFTLVVDRSDERTEDAYTTKHTTAAAKIDRETADKISKLERMTQANGASEQEEQTARAAIEKLKNKNAAGEGSTEERVLAEPAHKANPPRCNWHIEKNGIIIAKGNGLLKFYHVIDLSLDSEKDDYTYFKTATPEEWKDRDAQRRINRWGDDPESAAKAADYRYKCVCEDYALLDKFTELLTSWSNLCGGQVGNAGEDGFVYEEVEITEYKTELQPKETATGEIKDGQMFILKSNFNYCRHKGTVFVIRSSEYTDRNGQTHITYTSNALGKGYKREKTGSAYENHFSLYDIAKFEAWIAKGSIAWCELEEVKTPYQVKKVVKKPIEKNEKSAKTTAKADTTTTGNTTTSESDRYTIAQDTHTKTGEIIFTVKINPNLTPDEWKAEREKMKVAGGYYSKFKHAFIFKTEEEARAAAGLDTEESTQTEENTDSSGNTTEGIQPEFTIGGKATGKLHVEKVINGRVLYIIDAAELPGGRYETIVMNHDHIDIAITTTADKDEARRAFWEYCKLYEVQPDGIEPPTDEEPMDVPQDETPTDDTPTADETAPEEPTTSGENITDEEPTEEEKTEEETPAPPKTVPGYTGETSEAFTAEEIKALTYGEQVRKVVEGYNTFTIATPYTEQTSLVYRMSRYIYRSEPETDPLNPGDSLQYIGFINGGKFYANAAPIVEEMREDINAALLKEIPDEATAEERAADASDWQKERTEAAKGYDYTREAQCHFYEGTTPTLQLYRDGGKKYSAADIIRYIENPGEIVTEYRNTYAENHAAEIHREYIEYNRTTEAYNAIITDVENPAHVIKAIADSIHDEKTVRIELTNGETVKAEARTVRNIRNYGTIDAWHLSTADAEKLPKNENGRPADITAEDIKAIYHGQRTLYEKPAA